MASKINCLFVDKKECLHISVKNELYCKGIEFALQKDRFWTAKEVSLERKGIGFEKGAFFTSKSGLFATKSVLFRNNT